MFDETIGFIFSLLLVLLLIDALVKERKNHFLSLKFRNLVY